MAKAAPKRARATTATVSRAAHALAAGWTVKPRIAEASEPLADPMRAAWLGEARRVVKSDRTPCLERAVGSFIAESACAPPACARTVVRARIGAPSEPRWIYHLYHSRTVLVSPARLTKTSAAVANAVIGAVVRTRGAHLARKAVETEVAEAAPVQTLSTATASFRAANWLTTPRSTESRIAPARAIFAEPVSGAIVAAQIDGAVRAGKLWQATARARDTDAVQRTLVEAARRYDGSRR